MNLPSRNKINCSCKNPQKIEEINTLHLKDGNIILF